MTFFVKHVKLDLDCENCFGIQNEPQTAILSFSGVLKHFRRKLLNSHFGPKIDYLRMKLELPWDGIFFSSNECETALILSKTVLNMKMSQIGQFIAILGICIVFFGKHLKLPLCGKKCAISEISPELMETTFSDKYMKLAKYC